MLRKVFNTDSLNKIYCCRERVSASAWTTETQPASISTRSLRVKAPSHHNIRTSLELKQAKNKTASIFYSEFPPEQRDFLLALFRPGSCGTKLGQSPPHLMLKPTTGACISAARGLHLLQHPWTNTQGMGGFSDEESPFVKKPQKFSPTKRKRPGLQWQGKRKACASTQNSAAAQFGFCFCSES